MRTFAIAATLAVAAGQQGPDLILNTCSAAAAKFQQFSVYKTVNIILSATAGNTPPSCLDIEGYNTSPGAEGEHSACGVARAAGA